MHWRYMSAACLLLSIFGASLVMPASQRFRGRRQSNSDTCTMADIIFVLDSSGSIGIEHWSQVLDFVKTVVRGFNIGPFAMQFGSVTFGNEATINFNLNTYNRTQDVLDAVDRIQYKDENTNTSGGIWTMRQLMFTKANGDRPLAPDLAIVITDGVSTYDHEQTIPYANEAKRAGITIIVIGVGDLVDQTELIGMASAVNDTPLVFNVTSYDALFSIQESISAVACDIPVGELTHRDVTIKLASCRHNHSHLNHYVTLTQTRTMTSLSRTLVLWHHTHSHLKLDVTFTHIYLVGLMLRSSHLTSHLLYTRTKVV